MRCFLVALLFDVCISTTAPVVSHQLPPDPKTYKPVYEVFGDAESIIEEQGIARRAAKRASCNYPIQALFLVDSSGSMTTKEFSYVQQSLPGFAASLMETHPGSSLSLAWFEDKPIETLGELTDSCLEIGVVDSSDLTTFNNSLQSIVVGGGYDWPETQLSALVAAVSSPTTFNWFPRAEAVPVIFLITDAAFHYAEDSSASLYPQLSPWGDAAYNETAASQYCLTRYYPDPFYAVDLLVNRFYLATGVVNPELYDQLALRSYEWFNTLLNQPDALVQPFASDYTGWAANFNAFLTTIDGLVCSASTPSPTGSTASSASLGTLPASTTMIGQPTTELAEDSSLTTAHGGFSSEVATGAEQCTCPNGGDDCCWKQPEVLIALLKRPAEFDVHYKA